MTKLELLEWLSKEDVTPLGSCQCPELRELENDGFVKVMGEAVILTRKGEVTMEMIIGTRALHADPPA